MNYTPEEEQIMEDFEREKWRCRGYRESGKRIECDKEGDVRYSFGIYAGIWCDECWPKSGYRDAENPDAQWSPMDAGEAYWEDEY